MHYHIVGIAGAGMSAIAHVLLDQGHTVSGSDLQRNALAEALAARGAAILQGHAAEHVVGADAIVITSAVRPHHPEVAAAEAAGLPILKRADLWRAWSAQRSIIAVAGTHGKTTTTAMIALGLLNAGFDPGFLLGGEAPDLPRNARWGNPTAPLVIEADEYDRTFLALTPQIAVITNIELDHVDIYPDEAEYDAAFRTFAEAMAHPHNLIMCGDDPGVQRALAQPAAQQYGIDDNVWRDPVSCRRTLLDWMAANVRSDATGTSFDIWRYDRQTLSTRSLEPCRIQLSGTHNVRNALAAIAALHAAGVAPAQAIAALAGYRGTRRRFELKGEVGGVTVVDDYAHHPSEARATLAAARSRYGNRRIIAYFQPHTYSRTSALLADWASAFADADVVLVGDIYAARETDTLGLDSALVAQRLAHPQARAVGSLEQATAALRSLMRPGDVILTLGAGDGYLVGEQILSDLQTQAVLSAHEG
jgi:UDP-N-acetylmuramate--alanine ligase